ncbi:EAL domain-containing protein [Clostridium sp. SYSU_GA19001]|uniref:EAL domain-containing protein n=1 Tax=Clostridium caldaquaticum TaxID=2940653 RepID=UPI0020774450|nr:EAL domain-containing protein [Clostridium caldaquaticum]MCM8711422.1 EAL domain-containing protein [Clostridium caldaquaticum]
MKEVTSTILNNIIEEESIEVHYQPVVSIVKKSTIGLEGLSRGVFENELIDPLSLFKKASKDKKNVLLDRICREKVIENFCEIYLKHKDMLLFLNIDISTMTDETVGSGFVINLVNKYNIKPGNIVLEFVESKVSNVQALTRFIETYRNYGFLIALDDIGSGRSNLDRIAIVRPDIIKIDMAIVKEIHIDYYKQEVFKSLVSLSKTLGAMVVAEGIETEEEAMKAIELGADMLQGYYFATPQKISSSMIKTFNQPIRKVASHYSTYLEEKIRQQKTKSKEYGDIIKDILNEISQVDERRFDYKLFEIINNYKIIECIYILNPEGIQVTDTVSAYGNYLKRKSLIFKPAKKGEDHSLKKYYYFLKNMKVSKYLTEPYISNATGNLCMTMSCVFKSIDNKKFILCIDLNPDYFNI